MTETLTPTKTPIVVRPIIKGDPRFGNNGHDFEECEHIVKLDDPDTSLCGVDQTDVPWNQGFPPCQACIQIARGGLN
jgi:hypothetical protein